MKKPLSILSALAAIFTLAACTPAGEDSEYDDDEPVIVKPYSYPGLNALDNAGSETGTIKFQAGGGAVEMNLWNRMISDFEAKNPGINVELVTINDNDSLLAALSSGNAPDVVQVSSEYFGNWAKKGAFQAIQPFIDEELKNPNSDLNLDDIWEQARTMYTFNTETGIRGNGSLFALPKDFGVNGIFVNKKIVDQAHNSGDINDAEYALVTDQVNPMTYEQYLDIAVKLTKYDGTANSIYGTNRVYWESYLWSTGDDILTEDYKLNYQSENVKKVFQYSLDMVNKNNPATFCAPYTSAQSTASQDEMSLFTTGKMAMYWSGRWQVPSYDASAVNYYCIPVPVADLGNGERGDIAGWCSTIGYCISRNSKNTRMAYKLIKYLSSAEGQRIMNELNYAVPCRKSLITEPRFADPKTNNGSRSLDAASAQTFFKMAEKAKLANGCRFTTDAWIKAFEQKLDLLFTGDIETVDDFLNSVRGEVNSAIKRSDPQLFTK